MTRGAIVVQLIKGWLAVSANILLVVPGLNLVDSRFLYTVNRVRLHTAFH